MLAHFILVAASLWSQSPAIPAAACSEWHECQRLALDARARGDFERFHDLAWRTVQTGPAHDTDLMLLLARAQSLSGRPHDALVMLGRLLGMHVAADVAGDEDFKAVRQLRQWPELEAALAAAAHPAGGAATKSLEAPVSPAPAAVTPPPVAAPPMPPTTTAAPAATATPPTIVATPAIAPPSATPPAPVSAPIVATPRHAEEALRIPGSPIGSAGLAYDRVSSRFVVADADGQKLQIIDERSHHVIDLVTAASAGFYGITGLEIDSLRGDLWVVSAAAPPVAGDGAGAATALNKLQLVSGRPLFQIAVPADLQPCRLADVAVAPDGTVFVLDTAGGRLLRVRPGTRAFTPAATLHVPSPTSIATAGDRIVYVAHEGGIARVDTVGGSVEPLATARGVSLAGFERIRSARGSLVGVQRQADGSRRAVRVRLADGRAAAVEVIDSELAATDQPIATVSGDEFFVLVHEPAGGAGDLVIRRSRLR